MPSKLVRPTVELFFDGEILDANDLHRRGAFTGMHFPFRRLRTFPDRVEQYWRDRTKPTTIILVEWRPVHFGGKRPFFFCPKCTTRCVQLYTSSIDVGCRACFGLQYQSQRQRRKARLRTKAQRIRNNLWADANGNPIRPHGMFKSTFDRQMHMLQRVEQAIRTNGRYASVRYWRSRIRDSDGTFAD